MQQTIKYTFHALPFPSTQSIHNPWKVISNFLNNFILSVYMLIDVIVD